MSLPGDRVRVAAGILVDGAGRVLLSERLGDTAFAGLWEFPGGKLRPDETALQALARELNEELGIDIGSAEPFRRYRHDYADRRVDLEFFLVRDWRGRPRGLDGQALRWRLPGDIAAGDLLPADAPLLEALRNLSLVSRY